MRGSYLLESVFLDAKVSGVSREALAPALPLVRYLLLSSSALATISYSLGMDLRRHAPVSGSI